MTRRLRAARSMFEVAIDQFDHVGTIPTTDKVPKLWIYRFAPAQRRGFDPLVLDEHGHGWTTKRNRSYKAGFRWVSIDDRRAVGVCGLASHVFSQPPPGTCGPWDDDLEDDAGDDAAAAARLSPHEEAVW